MSSLFPQTLCALMLTLVCLPIAAASLSWLVFVAAFVALELALPWNTGGLQRVVRIACAGGGGG